MLTFRNNRSTSPAAASQRTAADNTERLAPSRSRPPDAAIVAAARKTRDVLRRALDWLTAGASRDPHGRPCPTPLDVLRRKVNHSDVDRIARRLASQAWRQAAPITRAQIRREIRAETLLAPTQDETDRVTRQLARHGWNPAAEARRAEQAGEAPTPPRR